MNAAPAASLSPTIHLIDDDAAVRDSLALLIGTVGLRVQTWSDPQFFLEGFEREGIGAIVLDVRMPGISGLSVLDSLVAQGVGVWMGFQSFINIGLNLGALPTKGLTLPLMSYGGSAILINLVALAIVLRVDYENRQMMRGGRK